MSVGAQLVVIVLSVGALLAAMAGVKVLAKRYQWSAELQRKIVHVTTGLYALSLPLTFATAWPVLLLCALAILVMAILRLPHFSESGLGSVVHSVDRTSYGELFLALSVGFLFFRSIDTPVLFVLPILVLTFSDAIAALTGVHYGKRVFAVEKGHKSVEGVVMFFLVTFILSMVTLLMMTDIARPSVILISLIVAVFGAQIEADSWRGFDNLFVPIGIHLFLENNLAAPPIGLLGSALLYFTILVALWRAAPRLDLTAQAARGYGVLAFVILSVTAPHNAILPIMAVAAFLIVKRVVPCTSTYPDLDFLAVAAGVAAGWLFAGEWSGYNAINLYNLTFAGVAVLFAGVALGQRAPALAPVIIAVTGVLVFAFQFLNAPEARWMPLFNPAIVLSLTGCFAAAVLYPSFFERFRSGRAFIVALVVPLSLFSWKTFLT